ncbi:MAG: alpha/beta hydrolase [Comamonadaceae bacterium]|nr:alpha/beta hydrolase [Comamonadaceae bacterium]
MSTLEEPISIAVDEAHLDGTLVTPGTLIPGVLFVHGWGGSQQQYLARAREIAALGCVCLTFDLRGHAEHQSLFETVSRAHNLQDVLAAYDTLVQRQHVDPRAIAVVGSSYGGYLGAILSSMRPVKWLALRAPALYHDDGWESPKLQLHKDRDLRAYRSSLVPMSSNRALQASHDFKGDMLLIESELDDVVPKTTLDSYREAAQNARSLTYRCMDGANHGLTGERDQSNYSAVLIGWLKEMIAGARRVPPEPIPTSDSLPPEAPVKCP